jgi:hypothetical protein
MMRTLPLAAAFAALCIGFALPAQSSDDAGDPNMKFFYPDGSLQWEDDRDFDRDSERMEKARKGGSDRTKSGRKSPGGGKGAGDGATPKSGQRSY